MPKGPNPPWDEDCPPPHDLELRKLKDARRALSTVVRHLSSPSSGGGDWDEECRNNVKDEDGALLKKVRADVQAVVRLWAKGRPSTKKK